MVSRSTGNGHVRLIWSAKSADKTHAMTKYTDMRCSEREEHHQDLVAEGFEWCPECGSLLDWHTESSSNVIPFRSPPTYAGDYPPITSDDLQPIA